MSALLPPTRYRWFLYGITILLTAAALVTAAATFLPRPLAPLPGTAEEREVETRLNANPFPDEPAE